jgi:hypothetical protein
VLVLLAAAALADPSDGGGGCPDVGERTTAARAAYDAVEMDAARAALDEAFAALACQTRVVEPARLLELYHTSALVALTVDDRDAFIYATLRAVAADHRNGRPGDAFGPELQAQYDTWAARLGSSLVTIRVDGGGTVYVDGRPADANRPLAVVQGEHVVQIDKGDGAPVRTEVRELSAETLVPTGVPLFAPPVPDPEPVVPVPVVPVAAPEPAKAKRRRPAGLWLATAATAGGAGFLLASGYLSEQRFLQSPYIGGTQGFDACSPDDACYDLARADAIRTDASRINVAYGVGYGLSAVSGGLLVLTVVGL